MADEPIDQDRRKQMVSRLVDGDMDPTQVRAACAAWREDAQVRETWHTYQLIGDVMRSDDLALAPQRDEAFLLALRARLANEPVVLAPSTAAPEPVTSAPATAPRRHWAAPLAVAAGFVAVAGVLVVTRLSAPLPDPNSGAALAQTAPAVTTVAASSGGRVALPAAAADVVVQDARVIRDARLDRYLAAHKQFGGGGAVAVPVVSLRHAATVVPER